MLVELQLYVDMLWLVLDISDNFLCLENGFS